MDYSVEEAGEKRDGPLIALLCFRGGGESEECGEDLCEVFIMVIVERTREHMLYSAGQLCKSVCVWVCASL